MPSGVFGLQKLQSLQIHTLTIQFLLPRLQHGPQRAIYGLWDAHYSNSTSISPTSPHFQSLEQYTSEVDIVVKAVMKAHGMYLYSSTSRDI
jgi:hypothetical protein